MKRMTWPLVAATTLFLALPSLAVRMTALAAPGPTLSFFSGGNGGHADWLATSDQPPATPTTRPSDW